MSSSLHFEYEVDLDSGMRYLGNGEARTREEVGEYHRRRLATAGLLPGLGYWVGFRSEEFAGW